MNAKKDDKTGNWVCSECQTEDLNRMFLRTLGPNNPKCHAFIEEEDRKVRKHNDAARRLNEVSGQYLMQYKRNRYTGSMPLSASSTTIPTARKTIGERVTYSKETGLRTPQFG
jgi:hypothetical protein